MSQSDQGDSSSPAGAEELHRRIRENMSDDTRKMAAAAVKKWAKDSLTAMKVRVRDPDGTIPEDEGEYSVTPSGVWRWLFGRRQAGV